MKPVVVMLELVRFVGCDGGFVVVTLIDDELVVPLELVAFITILYVVPALNPEKETVLLATPWSLLEDIDEPLFV